MPHKFQLSLVLIAVIAASFTGLFGCKRSAIVEIPRNILEAKEATQEELLHLLNSYGEIETLQASI